jgi:hypothetical protein
MVELYDATDKNLLLLTLDVPNISVVINGPVSYILFIVQKLAV